jgi:dUTP pyrophosphatase
MKIRVKRLADVPLPEYQTEHAAGMDLRAVVAEQVTIGPGERALIPTALILEIPPGFEGQVRPRSGLALKHGVTVLNSPGTIDADYRGEVKVLLINHGKEPFVVCNGDRVAQLIIAAVEHVKMKLVVELEETERGAGGYGSTGV